MKKLLIFYLCLGFISAQSQGILAGDTTTPGTIYVDIIPNASISPPGPNSSENFSIDVGNDGIADIKFWATWSQTMGMSSESTGCYNINEANISCYWQNTEWVGCYAMMNIINSSSCWNISGILKKFYSDPWETYTAGIFSNGYIGFRINMNNQISYGWIKASATTSSVTIYEYAYQDFMTGVDDKQTYSDITLWPNPVKNILNIDFPEGQNIADQPYLVVNSLGKKVIEGNINSGNPSIDCSMLPAGYYFINLTDRNSFIKPQKILKY